MNDTSESVKSSASIDSGEDGILEEFTDKSISSSKNTIDDESFFITPKKLKNKQRIISDESEIEEKVIININLYWSIKLIIKYLMYFRKQPIFLNQNLMMI